MLIDLGFLPLDNTPVKTGDLIAESEVDTYQFDLSNTADISINLIVSGTNDADFELYRDLNNNNVIEPNEVEIRDDVGSDFLRLSAQKPGTYFIDVIGYEASNGFNVLSYDLNIRANRANDENTPPIVSTVVNGVNLDKLSLGQQIERQLHEFSSNANVKYRYQFELENSGSLQIRTNILTASDDIDLELFEDTNNNGQFDDSDISLGRSINSGDDTIDIQEIPSGNYFLDVPLIDNSNDNFLEYQLIFDYEPSNISPTPGGESFTLALQEGTAQIAYVAYYGRPADSEGANFWNGVFQRENINYSPQFGRGIDDLTGQELSIYNSVVNDFGNSPEANRVLNGLTNRQKINQVYNFAFNRDGDSDGLNYWTNQLELGNVNLTSFALEVALGAKNRDLIVLLNKIESANVFSQVVEANPDTTAHTEAFARNWLSGYGDTVATIADVNNALSVLNS